MRGARGVLGRVAPLLLLLLPLGGCAVARMQGFDALAAGGERIDLTGVPAWRDGGFRLGSASGHVRRRSSGVSRASGTLLPPDAQQGAVERGGTLFFRVSGAEAGGLLEGECRFDRAEAFLRRDAWAVSAPTRPLALDCRYRLDGQEAGTLALDAAPPPFADGADRRLGRVRWKGTTLVLRSIHEVAGAATGSSAPAGYVAEEADGRPVGAAELTGSSRHRLVLPRDPALRAPAVAALLTLALFWDPGDVD